MPPVKPTLAPAAKALVAAKAGFRARLPPSSVRPGCLAWMPFATVIKKTHRDHHKECSSRTPKCGGDGVQVMLDGSCPKTEDKGDRPRRRAWNHPCVIVKKEGNDVWILGLTSFKGRELDEKLEKYPLETRRKIARGIVGIASSSSHGPDKKNAHILAREGDEKYQDLLIENKTCSSGGEEGTTSQRTPKASKSRAIGGYVKLTTVYKMDWRDLQRWNGGDKCLDDESTARLVGLIGQVCGKGWVDGEVEEDIVDLKKAIKKRDASKTVAKKVMRPAASKAKTNKSGKESKKKFKVLRGRVKKRSRKQK